jgi:hypothetical protein
MFLADDPVVASFLTQSKEEWFYVGRILSIGKGHFVRSNGETSCDVHE